MKINNIYQDLIKEDTNSQSVPFKYIIKNVGNITPEGTLKYTKKVKNGDTSLIGGVLTDFINDFPQLESDDKLKYLIGLFRDDDIINFLIPVTFNDNKITIDKKISKNLILFAKELNLYAKNHNESLDETK